MDKVQEDILKNKDFEYYIDFYKLQLTGLIEEIINISFVILRLTAYLFLVALEYLPILIISVLIGIIVAV